MRYSAVGWITVLSWTASAGVISINATDFTPGLSTQVIQGLHWQSNPGQFSLKTVAGHTGVGISGGATGDEIDIGETLTATTTGLPFWVPSFTLGVLFDGPEFNDVQEVAQITITSLSQGTLSFTLSNIWDPTPFTNDVAVWSGPGVVANLSPSANGHGAVWRITKPFGTLNDITNIQFTALAGICGNGACTNQSDFTFNQFQYEQVPEAPPAVLLAIGLLALGGLRRLMKSKHPAI